MGKAGLSRSDGGDVDRVGTEDPPRTTHGDDQTTHDDEGKLDRTPQTDHESAPPGDSGHHLGEAGRSQSGVPRICGLVRVTLGRDDRGRSIPSHRGDSVCELDVLARWDEQHDHSLVQVSYRNRSGDEKGTWPIGGHHAAGEDWAHLDMEGDHRKGQGGTRHRQCDSKGCRQSGSKPPFECQRTPRRSSHLCNLVATVRDLKKFANRRCVTAIAPRLAALYAV